MDNVGYKIFGLVKRPAHISPADLKQWWLFEHSPKVARWPGLVKYSINLTMEDDCEFDGLAEIWFEDKAAMDNVFNTPEGEIAKQSALSGSGKLVLLRTEEFSIVDKQALTTA
ncbi:MAG: hypothetical protein ACI9FJ_001467 [Alteromonadaceae bacterium]|jgi:hypothetical protein